MVREGVNKKKPISLGHVRKVLLPPLYSENGRGFVDNCYFFFIIDAFPYI